MNAVAQSGEVWAKDKQSVVMVQGAQGADHFYIVPVSTHGQVAMTREQLDEWLRGYQKVGEFVIHEAT